MKRIQVNSGDRYGRWTIIKEVDCINGVRWFECQCDCGTIRKVQLNSIRHKNSTSCGCYNLENKTKHGDWNTPTYRSYRAMINRCYDVRHPAYHQYGGRGITVCDRWLNSYQNFKSDMGERPIDKTLDRYPNNETGIYEPSNCRWATIEQQNENRRPKSISQNTQ